jgi:malonate-semialdehyde dehydrogenase (acetylating)/methylmalonate-semialdehyde dehydrogenase
LPSTCTSTGTATGKRIQALGGAKNHMIVTHDADLDQAADALVGAAYGSAGERCMAISVAVAVGKGTADSLIGKLESRIADLRIGDGAADAPTGEADLGPLVTKTHLDKVSSYVELGVDRRRGAGRGRPQGQAAQRTTEN